jgi:signal transduction histidine kinase
MALVGLIGAQAGLVLTLLAQRRQRRVAHERIAEHLRLEAVVGEVNAVFAVRSANLDEQIRECLRRIAAFLGVDRGALWQPGADVSVFSVTYGGTTEKAALPAATLDTRHLPYLRARLESPSSGLSFARTEDLPPEAAAERTEFEAMGIRSLAAIPLHADNEFLGVLAFFALNGDRAWPGDIMERLRKLGEPCAQVLARAQSADAVLAALPGATAIIDSAGTIRQTNEVWIDYARGVPAESRHALAVGANYLDACRDAIGIPPDIATTVRTSVESVLRGEREEFATEYPAPQGGKSHWLEVRVRRLTRLEGGATVMHFDVTARRQAEATARRHLNESAHLDRVASMGQLASSIAHELNQPLTAILANAQAAVRLLGQARPDLAEVRACLADIIIDDQRAAEVIRHMRRLLRKGDFVDLPIAINDLIANTLGLMANDALLHDVFVEFAAAPALPVVYGDLVQIQQVILNLLANAITAAGSGPSPAGKVTVWTTTADTNVEIGVRDSGAGIAEADLARLFEPFFTTKSEGLGMGLAISRSIVEAHGGRLVAENDPGGGAVFRVHLPTNRRVTV